MERNRANADDVGTLQVFGGEPIGDTEYEWFCALRNRDDTTFVCSASLIGARFVLTAEHCIRDDSTLQIEVGYLCRDRDNCGRSNEVVDVELVFRHPEGGDMALLLLENPISIDVTVAVPYLGPSVHEDIANPLKKGQRLKLVGSGRKGEGGEITNRVHKLTVRSIKTKKCAKAFNDNPVLVTKFTTCSVALDGNPCSGDSGAALVVRGIGQWKGRDVIMAIHRLGYRDCAGSVKRPIGHFRLTYAADLLKQVVCGGDYGPPEDWCLVPPPKLKLVHTLKGKNLVSAHSASFNMDGSRLVLGMCGGTGRFLEYGMVLVWDISGKEPRLLADKVEEESICMYAAAFHPRDSSLIASVSDSRKIFLWKMDETQQQISLVQELQGFQSCCLSSDLAWHPSGDTLAASSTDTSIAVWNILAGVEQRESIPPDENDDGGSVRSLAFSVDGALLASASFEVADRTVKIWRTSTNPFTIVQSLEAEVNYSANAVAFSPNNKFLAAACEDGRVLVWDIVDGELVYALVGHEAPVDAIAWSPDSKYIVSGDSESMLHIWDGENGGVALVGLDAGGGVRSLDWSPNGLLIAAALSGKGRSKVWRVIAPN